MKVFWLLVLAFLLFPGCGILGGGGAQPNTTNGTIDRNATVENYTCIDGTVVSDPSLCPRYLCPSSCDDWDVCTRDYCGPETFYECAHDEITPCCGNGECEDGEDMENCLDDCGACAKSCDDFNPCTIDNCNKTTMYRCVHKSVTGQVLACSGYMGFEGYSSINYKFGISPPAGWAMDAESDRGVMFIGPKERANCSKVSFFDKDYYSDWVYGFSVKPPSSWVLTTSDSWTEGIVFHKEGWGADIYITSKEVAEDSIGEYAKTVRSELLYATESGAEIGLLGTTMRQINISEDRYELDGIEAYEFVVSGSSNRLGAWTEENQKHVYLMQNGRLYVVALAGDASSYLKTESLFSEVLESFQPMASFDCDENEEYAANILISSLPSTPGKGLEDYVKSSLEGLGASADYVTLDTMDDTLDGVKARAYVVSFIEFGIPIKRNVVVALKSGRVYKLEFSSIQDQYQVYWPVFKSVKDSFRMLGDPEGCLYKLCVDGTCSTDTLDFCCGNDVCEESEDCESCAKDCGACSSIYPELDARVLERQDGRKYETFNCEQYKVRVNIHNNLDERLTVLSENAFRFRTYADTVCRAEPRSSVECEATMSGAFGDAYSKGVAERKLKLYAFPGTEFEEGEPLYKKTLYFNVSYDIYWVGPYCLHFYCIPGNKKMFMGNEYTITGVKEYPGDVLIGNWWCDANRTHEYGSSEIYYNQFYNKTCLIERNTEGKTAWQTCYGG